MTQVEFHRLLTHQQARPNLCVRQPLHTTKCYLRFASAQVLVIDNSLDNSLIRTASRAFDSLRIRLDASLLTSCNNLLRLEDAISSSVIARPVTIRFNFALNTKLCHQPFDASSDRAQADNT